MIKIEVTGANLGEVADKLLAIGSSLLATDHQRIRAKGARQEARFIEAELAEVAQAAPVDPTPAPKSAPPAEVSESQPTTAETSSTPAPAALDFDTDVAPHVLAVVQKLGKPVAQEILSQFGVEKASLLDPARWPELVTALQDAG
tara:strand:+ start:101 stop:535 length:435 start_codon:yes stop_codon:yes gene_type:complete